jgi:predicted nucleotide-binding protein (sugar kinase/HSP70/actin superfamily)
MKKGDIVKFKNESKEEKEARENGKVIMKIVWVDAPRLMIVADIGHMTNPTSIHNIEDVELCAS